ncbi:50S ribosomal protein L10, partial [Streptomyces sp. NPDC002814]
NTLTKIAANEAGITTLDDLFNGPTAVAFVTGELAKLSEIRARGDITDEEFSRAKQLVLSDYGPPSPPSGR